MEAFLTVFEEDNRSAISVRVLKEHGEKSYVWTKQALFGYEIPNHFLSSLNLNISLLQLYINHRLSTVFVHWEMWHQIITIGLGEQVIINYEHCLTERKYTSHMLIQKEIPDLPLGKKIRQETIHSLLEVEITWECRTHMTNLLS